MSGVVVTGIGWVTASGAEHGRSGAAFSMIDGPLPALPAAVPKPGQKSRRGRQPEYSRVGMVAIGLSLRDAGYADWESKRPFGISASTRLGCLATDIEYYESVLPAGGGMASPYLFAYTLANCFIGEAAIEFGLTGPMIVANDGRDDSISGWRLGIESVLWGESATVIAGHVDFPVGQALPGLAPTTPGSVFMVLESPSSVRRVGGRPAGASDYGTLDLSGGTVTHNGQSVGDLEALVRSCLAARVA